MVQQIVILGTLIDYWEEDGKVFTMVCMVCDVLLVDL